MIKSLKKYIPLLIVGIIAASIGGVITANLLIEKPALAEDQKDETVTIKPVAITGDPNAIANVAEMASKAVVKIETTYKPAAQKYLTDNPFFNDPFFRYFFGDIQPMPDQAPREGMGSGFIFREDGYILTNDHVVRGADEINVFIYGYDKPLKAEIVGADASLDLAVLKVDPKGKKLPTVKLGDSNKLRIGEWAVAIGDPYGMDWTVTAGVISAKGRPLTIRDNDGRARRYKDLIQTDAAINPGNSGGPLLNLKGEVIGINTAVNAAAQGIGFAIPINTAKEVLSDLIDHGQVIRPWLGVSITDVTEDMAEALGLSSTDGVLVADVVPGSPADKAGIMRYDVILEVNKTPVKSSDHLVELIRSTDVDETVAILISRNGRTRLVTAKIDKAPADLRM
ncbi:MAG: trypsin-like peptidase domain-containing protein [Firmicutes bacterium]|nr:trypsin-like peptidase domain-containing protein [Bacillota bacterium]